jgi:UDP-N-acetylmuramate--alanine ligase
VQGEKMLNLVNFSGKPFHFIGIGGIGMSALAHILARQGYQVSGSDLNENHITEQLRKLGVKVYKGHSANNIDAVSSPQVVCSTAINPQNPEFQAAKSMDLPILHRSDVLAALISQFKSIAVSGTHGKTTTSSLISFLLLQAGLDPTIVIGGEVKAWEGNARLGEGEYLVAEADESDGSLVKFSPHLGVITNIELDHPDHYHSLEQVISTFQAFAKRCQVVVACTDCLNTKQHIQPHITYSLTDPSADYSATQVEYDSDLTRATILEKGKPLGAIELGLLGQHNLANALAAIAVCRYVGVEWPAIQSALPEFGGASRRFELKGEQDGVIFVDDYAHHPSEIRATLASARQQGHKQIVAIFQPHRYSRTVKFLPEFSRAFDDADMVIVTDIYAAGEPNQDGVTGTQVAEAIAFNHPNVHYRPSLDAVQSFLIKQLKSGDLALFLGAGNLNQIIAPTIAAMASCLPVQI